MQQYALIGFIYLLVRFTLPMRAHWAFKVTAGFALFGISQYYYIIRNYFGSLASPELPFPVLLTSSWLFVSMAMLLLIILARDLWLIILLTARMFGRKKILPRQTARVSVLLVLLALLCGGAGLWSAVRLPGVRAYEVTLPGLPPELDGFTLLHLSDLHISALLPEWRTKKLVEQANALKPDLTVITGDLIDGSTAKRKRDVAPLSGLKARYGVYACDGNHEYYSGYSAWMKRFAALNIKFLHNAHVLLPPGKPGFALGGLDDRAGTAALQQAFAGVPAIFPRILLEHRPDQARARSRGGVNLQLSGHTHGGQVFFLKPAAEKRNNGFARGWYEIGKMRLYVSRGAGLWGGFPLRLGVRSEMTLFTLRSWSLFSPE